MVDRRVNPKRGGMVAPVLRAWLVAMLLSIAAAAGAQADVALAGIAPGEPPLPETAAAPGRENQQQEAQP